MSSCPQLHSAQAIWTTQHRSQTLWSSLFFPVVCSLCQNIPSQAADICYWLALRHNLFLEYTSSEFHFWKHQFRNCAGEATETLILLVKAGTMTTLPETAFSLNDNNKNVFEMAWLECSILFQTGEEKPVISSHTTPTCSITVFNHHCGPMRVMAAMILACRTPRAQSYGGKKTKYARDVNYSAMPMLQITAKSCNYLLTLCLKYDSQAITVSMFSDKWNIIKI